MDQIRRVIIALAAVLVWALVPNAVQAEEHELVITHMEIAETNIRPKVGDTVKFINQADIAHNLYLTYEDGTVQNLDTQFPGMSKTAKIERSGKVVVRCWIHPVIRMEFDAADAD
ncbi:Methylamine utilization protein MauL [Candidatus Filomicrobium marinum]|uniref:Methylamine utilization protein MauL n=2 Tax=Filomicrobium TaxID=119044 RepID=A0A0D6JK14_9HYPH|nr:MULTISPECIES: methylamine utilization protein MauL [Filomicrobium]CFX58483.1 Methylamine utilization protein MauL [Candidatus Filomicrobium marinum]CPR22329.1 Methylamine utilization protein MauL [Candidatus Filomicrobium marinum]SDO88297.1 hypothetical protein SAMN04488061_1908 [Filomicrobium insigne]